MNLTQVTLPAGEASDCSGYNRRKTGHTGAPAAQASISSDRVPPRSFVGLLSGLLGACTVPCDATCAARRISVFRGYLAQQAGVSA